MLIDYSDGVKEDSTCNHQRRSQEISGSVLTPQFIEWRDIVSLFGGSGYTKIG